ncbi:MAG: PEGA domain-containing protein [Myxococcota bacterium]
MASSRGTTHVDSRPSGADVFVMGQRVGRTPVDVEDRLVFPVHYPSSLAALYGRIVLERPGCDRIVRTVGLSAANEGLVVDLDCGPRPGPEAPTAATGE